MLYIVHDQTGLVQRWGSDGQEAHFWERVVESDTLPDPGAVYWSGQDWQALPPRPADWAVWDGAAWVDPRTEGEIADELAARRAAVSLDKSELLIRLAGAGILTPADAEQAAAGAIPASMAAMLESLPPEEQMAARIKWRSDATISRTHPVIVAAAHALGVSDAQLDQIFGVMP